MEQYTTAFSDAFWMLASGFWPLYLLLAAPLALGFCGALLFTLGDWKVVFAGFFLHRVLAIYAIF